MRRERYLEKLETFEKELDFIKSHSIVDDITERALLHSLQICIEISTDLVAMLTHDLGLVVRDDYTNIENLENENILGKEENHVLKSYNGLRNAIVHRYNNLDMKRITDGLDNIDQLYDITVRLAEIYDNLRKTE